MDRCTLATLPYRVLLIKSLKEIQKISAEQKIFKKILSCILTLLCHEKIITKKCSSIINFITKFIYQ